VDDTPPRLFDPTLTRGTGTRTGSRASCRPKGTPGGGGFLVESGYETGTKGVDRWAIAVPLLSTDPL
jgi:hypothetical protein